MDYKAITLSEYSLLHDWSVNGKLIYTGADITADSVFSYSSGIVLAVGKDIHTGYCITIQYDVFNVLRYGHLKSVDVGAGDIVQAGCKLGNADRYVHFEYATKVQNDSKWSVRVGTETYWKQNPHSMQIQQPTPETIIGSATSKETWQGKGW